MSRDNYEDKAEFGNDEIEVEEDLEDGDGVEEGDSGEESPDLENPETEEGSPDEDGKPQPKKRDKSQTKINILQRERYRAINDLEKAMSERDFWQQKYELSSQTAMRQYDKNANYRLEKARANQVAAIESGDAQAQVDANVEIAAATTELQDLNNWKYQDDYEKQTRQYREPSYSHQPDQEIINAWAQDNSDWINPASKKYDRELVEYVGQADTWLASQLRAAGRDREIGGSDYLQEIDNFREAFIENRNRNTNQRGGPNMRQVRGGASPVRNGSGGDYRSNVREERLTSEERSLAKITGDEKRYMKEKLKFMKEEQEEQLNSRRRR